MESSSDEEDRERPILQKTNDMSLSVKLFLEAALRKAHSERKLSEIENVDNLLRRYGSDPLWIM